MYKILSLSYKSASKQPNIVLFLHQRGLYIFKGNFLDFIKEKFIMKGGEKDEQQTA